MDAAKCPDSQCSIHGGGEAFTRNVAQIKANGSVREFKVVQEIPADRGDRLELVRDAYCSGPERLRRQHHPLNRAGFLEFFFAQLLDIEFGDVHAVQYQSNGNFTGEG